ncbi:hypothetical protein BDB01DRAFT_323982 [Pilobolus umbonatus]|nr:hypothetical protein BDB01DRAFT_323982 [Pilobolus umbonatus]
MSQFVSLNFYWLILKLHFLMIQYDMIHLYFSFDDYSMEGVNRIMSVLCVYSMVCVSVYIYVDVRMCVLYVNVSECQCKCVRFFFF